MLFLYSQWMRLPLTTRATIATAFGIAKTGPTHVQDNRIIADGYNIEDVERALNIDAIQMYLGSEETDMTVLWQDMVAKAEGRETPIPDIISPSQAILNVVKAQEPLVKPPFCDSCTSKGTRHLKVCPKNT